MSQFFGLDPKETAKLDYNKLYQASRESNGKRLHPDQIPAEVKAHPEFKQNMKKFYGVEQSETQSNYNNAANRFYDVTDHKERLNPKNTINEKFQNVQDNVEINKGSEQYKRNNAAFHGQDFEVKSQGSVFQKNLHAFHGHEMKQDYRIAPAAQTQSALQVNTNSGHYKKDAAAFYNTKHCESESQGSVFQRNAANFYDEDVPAHGERPYKIDKHAMAANAQANQQQQPSSYLNEQRLKEHENNIARDPNYKKNVKRFYALPSQHTAQRSDGPKSTVEKLDQFITR